MLLRYFLGRTLILLALLSSAGPAASAQAPDYHTTIPDPKTLGESYVSDPDHLLRPATVSRLNATLRALDQSGRAHIDVALTRSIGREVPKTAATALFNRWRIGDKTQNNGLLLLIVEDQRRVEFETGYGLEADLPDVVCFRIQQRYLLPYLRGRQYDAAVEQGVAALIRQLTTGRFEPSDSAAARAATPAALAEGSASSTPAEEPADPRDWSGWERAGVTLAVIFLMILSQILASNAATPSYHRMLYIGVLLFLGLLGLAAKDVLPVPPAALMVLGYGWPWFCLHAYLLLTYRQLGRDYAHQSRHARYTFLSAAHHGLGFMRFLFPLGMAFYWPWHQRRLAALRTAAYACPSCATPMHCLDETQDDTALQPGQVAEERLEAIDYDVWRCPGCQYQLTLNYANLGTEAQVCSQCHYHTAQPQPPQEVVAATTAAGGWGWHISACTFCQHITKQKYTTARISSSSSSSSSGGGGSSSSSGSSSGGSSGGGGSGSSW